MSRTHIITLITLTAAMLLQGCSSTKPYTEGAIKTFDPDTSRMEMPEEQPQYQYWDRIDNTIFHQVEKPLDLNRSVRFVGRKVGVSSKRQADNINKLDEVPESSWYTRRHYYNEMSPKELAKGPNTIAPNTNGEWTIFRAKLEGANSGFFIKDKNGNRYLIKFDGYNYPELTTAADVISTKIFYASGYTVPESTITYFDPDSVKIGEGVTVVENGQKRPMTMDDYRAIVKGRPTNAEGNIRALASKFVDGIPLGPWGFEGTVDDDPNDRVAHEHRRELRGMRIISSWLNDTDRRDANTMAVYNDEGYIDHYVQDFGNTLGANGTSIHKPIQGQAYLIDPRYMLASALSMGGYVFPWETIEEEVPYPAVGYFRADVFRPGSWVPTHPIPSFENMTLRDAFWGAKQVMSFSDEDIRAIVKAGKYSNPEAEAYIVDVLIDRRNKIGRYWFDKMSPLGRFEIEMRADDVYLRFDDLAVEGKLIPSDNHRYQFYVYDLSGEKILTKQSEGAELLIGGTSLRQADATKSIIKVDVSVLGNRLTGGGKKVTTYVEITDDNVRIVGIDREE